MKLGIFGGTFNPVHLGHINASLEFYDAVRLDKMLVIPDRIPPHKSDNTVGAEHRLNMLHLVYDDKAVIGTRNIEISEVELKREGKSYTVVTLRELKKEYPDAKLFLYTGSDMFYTLENWREGSTILGMCSVYTAAREENEYGKLTEKAEYYKDTYGTECIVSDAPPLVVSSTEIRNCLAAQSDKINRNFTNNLLTDDVIRYIMKNRLYGTSEDADTESLCQRILCDLESLVKEKRLSHILAVRNKAEEIADFFIRAGFDLSRQNVILASLLHDITKYMDQEKLCGEYGICLSADDISSMQTVHAITGAHYAKAIYGVNNEICSAIERHTVGGTDMTLEEKIIFVSDYCEETRIHEQCAVSRRAVSEMIKKYTDPVSCPEKTAVMRDFDYIVADILGKTVKYLRDSDMPVHGKTVESFTGILHRYGGDCEFAELESRYLSRI